MIKKTLKGSKKGKTVVSPTLAEIQDQFTEAKERLLGKLVNAVVKRPYTSFQTEDYTKYRVNDVFLSISSNDSQNSTYTREAIRKNGYVIGVKLTSSNGYYQSTIPYFAENFVVIKEAPKVNGYEGVKDKDGNWTFGCAKIDGALIALADAMFKAGTGKGTRVVQSIKIGDGTFTKDIVEKLIAF